MKVNIEKQSDGQYIAYNTSGYYVTLIGTGVTASEAKTDFENSIAEVTQSYKDRGNFIPPELREAHEYYFDIASLFDYYSMLNVSALGRYLGINESLMRQYRKGDAPISDKQLERIEAGINRLGLELAGLRLI